MEILKRLYNYLFADVNKKIVILGIEDSAKSTLLLEICKHTSTPTTISTIPTNGFNLETVRINQSLCVDIWDIGGNKNNRVLYRHYLQPDINSILYLIDSSIGDTNKLKDSKEEYDYLKSLPNLKDVPFLLIASKLDKPNSLSINEISKYFNLTTSDSIIIPFKSNCEDDIINCLNWIVKSNK